jgi:hypothetical protein
MASKVIIVTLISGYSGISLAFGTSPKPNRPLGNMLKPSEVRNGHVDEFDCHTSWMRSSDHSSTMRPRSDLQRDLDLASGGNGIHSFKEAAV